MGRIRRDHWWGRENRAVTLRTASVSAWLRWQQMPATRGRQDSAQSGALSGRSLGYREKRIVHRHLGRTAFQRQCRRHEDTGEERTPIRTDSDVGHLRY